MFLLTSPPDICFWRRFLGCIFGAVVLRFGQSSWLSRTTKSWLVTLKDVGKYWNRSSKLWKEKFNNLPSSNQFLWSDIKNRAPRIEIASLLYLMWYRGHFSMNCKKKCLPTQYFSGLASWGALWGYYWKMYPPPPPPQLGYSFQTTRLLLNYATSLTSCKWPLRKESKFIRFFWDLSKPNDRVFIPVPAWLTVQVIESGFFEHNFTMNFIVFDG